MCTSTSPIFLNAERSNPAITSGSLSEVINSAPTPATPVFKSPNF